jgi:multiple sugar transport system ATP-binding protein
VSADTNELLGSETYVHFSLDATPVMTPDIEELLADMDRDISSLGEVTRFTARVSPDATVPDRSPVDLVVDTTKLHFFDRATSERIGGRPVDPTGVVQVS